MPALMPARRSAPDARLAFGEYEVDVLSRRLRRGPLELDLTRKEFGVLYSILRSEGAGVAVDALRTALWADERPCESQKNRLYVHVARLRSRLRAAFGEPLIHRHRQHGYCLRADGAGLGSFPA